MSGEGNGTPLQYSLLENPTDGGTWWAVVHGVTRSQTWLERLSSSSSSSSLEVSCVCREGTRVASTTWFISTTIRKNNLSLVFKFIKYNKAF